jgi:hypothetical protein
MFSLNEGLQLTVWSKKKSTLYCVINSMFLFIFIVFFDCRCCYHHCNDVITTHFLLLKHFWPCLNNVLHHWRTVHIDGLNKKIIISPTSVKMSPSVPPHPRVAAHRCDGPLQPRHPKKTRKKRSQLFFHRHIEPLYWLYSTYQNCRPFWNLWHTIHWKKSHILHCKQRQFVVGAINSGVNLDVSLLQLLDRVNNGLH